MTSTIPAVCTVAPTTPPADHPPAGDTGPATRSIILGGDLFARFEAEPSTVLLACYAHLVARFSGDYKVTVVFGDTAVAVDLADNPSFSELVRRVADSPVKPVDAAPSFHLTLRPAGSDQVVEVRYRADWFSEELIRLLLDAFRTLLGRVAADPDARVQDVPLLPEPRHPVLPAATREQPVHRYPPITDLVAAAVGADPAAAAVVKGGRSWSYAELDALSAEVAETLRAQGHQPGEVVAICPTARCFELYASMLGVWRAGGVFAMVDGALPANRRTAILDRARVSTLLVIGSAPPPWWRDTPVANVLLLAPDRGFSVLRAGRRRGRVFGDESAAYIFFTSGTTGPPKALLGRHNSLSHFVLWQRDEFDIRPGDRCAQLTSLFTDGVLRDIFTPLISGATLHVPTGPGIRMDDPKILGWLAESGVTVTHTMPSLAGHWLAGARDSGKPDDLRLLFFSGECLTGAHTERWHALAPQAQLVNLYGTSECTMIQAYHRVRRNRAELVQPAGTGMPGAQLLVLTPSGTPCGPGEVGRVHIRTPYTALGYLGHDRATFTDNPFRPGEPGDQVFPTEDRARVRPDGSIEVLGRASDVTSIDGVQVNPERVNALLAQEPGVHASAVLRGTGSDGTSGLIAFVVPAHPSDTCVDEVRQALQRKLPPEAVPVHIVSLPSLPVTAVGKLDRDRLRKETKI